MARTPHGYHDKAVIASDVAKAGLASSQIDTVAARSRADSARTVAIAYCQGTPMRNEIESRDARKLAAATAAAEREVARRFGTGAVEAASRRTWSWPRARRYCPIANSVALLIAYTLPSAPIASACTLEVAVVEADVLRERVRRRCQRYRRPSSLLTSTERVAASTATVFTHHSRTEPGKLVACGVGPSIVSTSRITGMSAMRVACARRIEDRHLVAAVAGAHAA
jgi:hypothetical protein